MANTNESEPAAGEARPLRRRDKRGPDADAWALLARAPLVHFASVTDAGAPLLRALHPVLDGNRVCFHGSALGERGAALDRPASVCAEEIVGEIPSYATDAERACPATTFFRSAMVHGVVREVVDLDDKARVLGGLMTRFQPEGRYVPIAAEDERYRKAIVSIQIVAVDVEQIVGKVSLGQGKTPRVRNQICEALWRRGGPTDAAAIDAIVDARPANAPIPAIATGPEELRWLYSPNESHLAGTLDLIRDAYWNPRFHDATLRGCHLRSQAWVVAIRGGEVIATARAVSDEFKRATVYDVAVRPDCRGRGIGEALMAKLLDHPQVRGACIVGLGTKDAQSFYAALGFREPAPTSTWMHLIRENALRPA